MANLTVREAIDIKGTDPQHLVEKIVRTRIYESRYWKEECFALTAELLVDKAIELKSIGGIFSGNIKPTPFLCLLLKMLQIQPEKDIIIEFIKNEEFKYVRALGAFYMRLTGKSQDVYKYLEPLYIDYRKMKRLNKDSKYEMVFMDEFIDELLHSDRVCDITMPRLQKRSVLEELNELEVRVSPLEVNLDDIESSEEEVEDEESEPESVKSESDEEPKKRLKKERKKSHKKSRSRSRSKKKDKKRNRSKSRSKSRSRSSSRERHKRSSRSNKYVDFDDPNEDELQDRRRRSKSRENHKKRHDSRERDRRRSRSKEKRSRR